MRIAWSSAKFRWLLAGLLVFAGGIGIGVVSSYIMSDDQVPELLQKGDAAFAEQKWAEALSYYQKAAAIKPHSKEIDNKIKLAQSKLEEVKIGTAAGNGATNTANGEPAANRVAENRPGPNRPAQGQPEQTQPQAGARPPDDTISQNTVPNLIGLSRSQAESLLLAKRMRYKFYIETSDAPSGMVYRQDPEPGQPYVAGQQVVFYVSR